MTINLDEKDEKASKVILKYSLFAAGSSFVPGKILDPFLDSISQYKMIKELEDIYEIKNTLSFKKFIAVIVDNLAWNLVGGKVVKFLKFLPPPYNSAAFLQVVWDFVTTFAIGNTFKKIYETAYRDGVDPDMTFVGELFVKWIKKGCTYLVQNFTTLLGLSKVTVDKYAIDFDAVISKMKKEIETDSNIHMQWKKAVDQTTQEVYDLCQNQKDFDIVMESLAKKIDTHSIELLEAEINIRELNGEDVAHLRSYLETL